MLRNPSTDGNGRPSVLASRPIRLGRRGGRTLAASDRMVLRRTPRSAGRTVASTTTATATAIAAATRGQVIGGAAGAPYRLGAEPANSGREQRAGRDTGGRGRRGEYEMLHQEDAGDLTRGDPDRLERADLTTLGCHPARHQDGGGRDGEAGQQGCDDEQGERDDGQFVMRARPSLLPRLRVHRPRQFRIPCGEGCDDRRRILGTG